jgi:class 3 adenylate cyclase
MLHRRGGSRRVLATVLFSDIVGSTAAAAAMGDAKWRALIAEHDKVGRAIVGRFHGTFVRGTGDGLLATFDSPARAVQCAQALVDGMRPLGVDIRAGIHTGEIEYGGNDLAGIAVHIGARVGSLAGPGEILVTSTVRELTAGSDVAFSDRGIHEFKGVPGGWHLYAVEWQHANAQPAAPGATDVGADAAARRTRPRRAVVGAGFAGAALVAMAAFGLLVRASAQPAPVPQPHSAIRIDPATNGILAVVPAGDSPTGIATDGDTVWALSQADRLLTGFPMAGGPPRTTGLPGPPTAIASGAGAIWITFGFGASGTAGGMLLRVATGPEQQQQKIPIGSGAGGIAFDGDAAWVVNGIANDLTRVDASTRTVSRTVPLADQPMAITIGEGSAWVVNAGSRTIWRLDPRTMEKTAEIAVPDRPTAIAVGFGMAWVTSDSGHSLAVIDASSNSLLATIVLEQTPRGIAAGPDAVWVATTQGALLRIDPHSRAVMATIPLPGTGDSVVASGESVWVTVQQ